MRIRTLHFLFLILLICLCISLFYLQIVKGPEYKDLSYKNSIRLLSIKAPRGVIYDRRGEVMVDNTLAFGVFIVPQEVSDLDAEIKKLAEILGVSESLLKRSYKRNYHAPFAPCEVMRSVSKRDAILIEESRLDMPGVLVKEFPLRRHASKEAFAHVVGYVAEINKFELETLKSYGYNVKDMIGKDGVEKIADATLRGKNGGMQVQVDNRGRQVKIMSFKKAEKGKDITLTIDAGLQDFVWKAMKGKKGAAVFMDSSSGEILAMVSSPSYDATSSVAGLLNDEDFPLLNRAIMGQYPPGSLFKVVVALAALETGKITPTTTFVCSGRLNVGNGRFHCWNRDGHGPMELRKAITQSCNVFFYNTGLLLGVDEISDYAKRFGFGKRTGIDLFGEIKGFVPTRQWKKTEKGEGWYAGDTANLSIGQGYLLVTPLQVARMMACVANGGDLLEPHVLKKDSKNKKALKIRQENLRFVRKALRGVVEDDRGTGFRAWSSAVSIAGKTGTSQPGGSRKTHAWFSGFAPAEESEIGFVVFLEHGGSGGDAAAVIARKAIEYWHSHR